MEKITFRCKVCSWEKSIPAEWDDVPQFCGNGKCSHSAKKAFKTKKSFRTDPESLEIIKPEIKVATKHTPVSKEQPKAESAHKEASESRKTKRRGYAPPLPTNDSEAEVDPSDG